MPDDTQIDLRQTVAELRRQLEARTIERDEALVREAANEERYALVTQAVAEGIYEWQIQSNSLWVSPRLIEIFGLAEHSLTAADWNSLVHPEDFPLYRAALRACFKGVTPRLDCEYRVRHSDGGYRWIEDRGVPVRDATGWAIRMVGALTDVSSRKAADEGLREALEQQTATAEVLQVINSSPGDLTPVFDAMLEKATRLCEAAYGMLYTYEDGIYRTLAVRDLPPAYAKSLKGVIVPGKLTALGRLTSGERVVHITDLREDEAYRAREPQRVDSVELGGARTYVGVPLLNDGAMVGAIAAYRQEVRPFTDKQIALLQNFAAQAVIAMENARLLTETREALEQQTATAEVLQVINSSPGDLAPVFDAILEKAHALCGVQRGSLQLFDGDCFRAVATRFPQEAEVFAERLRQGYPASDTPVLQPLRGGVRFVHVPDLAEVDDPVARAAVAAGTRSILYVPLRRDDAFFGMIVAAREEIRPFTDKEIVLLESFAAQAVIAMENARLLTETREALEQQTATAEVLQVINSSPGELTPVFEAMLEKALRLCGGSFGELRTYDGARFRLAATHSVPTAYVQHYARGDRGIYGPGTGPARILAGERVIHIPDLVATEPYQRGDPDRVALVELGGARAYVLVPLLKDKTVLGYIMIYRKEAGSFSDKQIALLQNFAAQAVIAMENARLLTETREALEQQTATAEVLQVINSSPGDLAPVFDAMLGKAMQLCEAAFGVLWAYEGDRYRAAAVHGAPVAFVEYLSQPLRPRYDPGSGLERALRGENLVITDDMAAEEIYRLGDPLRRAIVDLGGARSHVLVALRKDETLLGAISIYRQEVRPFTDKQIALLQNFAAQAVIAMENARLITETREALAQQTATAEVLQVINSSPGNLQPVFDAVLENATNLCTAQIAVLWMYDGDQMDAAAILGAPPEYEQFLRQGARPLSPTHERLRAGEDVIQIVNIPEYEGYRSGWSMARALFDLGRVRTILLVPLRSEEGILGAFAVYRQETQAFSNKQIALLQNFAAQAVVAMENARLLNELRDRTNELTRRQAELRVTFDNMGDGVAMFDEELRLAAWNRNFQEILELPDALLTQRPSLSDYIRYLATHGEYGEIDIEAEVRRLVEAAGRQYSTERMRPDGRVIEVRANPVPGGGIVLIYSDITERKRAEAEIRAARDAAETTLAELRTTQASLLHAQKMAALGQLTAGIAHEIKNPLNFVNNFADLSVELLDELKETTEPAVAALGGETRAEIDEIVEMLTANLGKIAEHGRRADGIVKSMLAHSRGSSGERQQVDVNALVEEALNLAYHGARAQDQNFNITLECELDHSTAPIELVPQDVTRVFLNLFGNGFYAANKRRSEGGEPQFKPTLKVTTHDLGAEVEIRVRDNGTGIAPAVREKLFQPFFTTKPTGEGTGLGLSISYDIVTQEHGGTIEVDSELGAFTEFTIRLPRSRQATTTGSAA